VNCDKAKETSVKILIPYKKSIQLVLQYKEWLVENNHLYLKFWAKLTSSIENVDFCQFLMVATQP